MKVEIKSCKGGCYEWYRSQIGKTFEVKPIGGINKDYIINDDAIKSMGTSFDSYISHDDIIKV